MKMSFFWMVMIVVNIMNIISDVAKSDYSFWIYLTVASLAVSVWLYFDSVKTERREAAAKKEFLTIIINHMGNESADETAKRVAEHLKLRS